MADLLNFDAEGIAPRTTYDVIPAGWYKARIVESEMKPTKRGDGDYLQLVWEILDGEHKGRKIWDRLNVRNPNETAQNIALESLSAICHAIGVLRIQNTGQLHDKPALIKISVKKQAGYDDQNEVKGYQSCEGAPAKPAAPVKVTAADDDLPF